MGRLNSSMAVMLTPDRYQPRDWSHIKGIDLTLSIQSILTCKNVQMRGTSAHRSIAF